MMVVAGSFSIPVEIIDGDGVRWKDVVIGQKRVGTMNERAEPSYSYLFWRKEELHNNTSF